MYEPSSVYGETVGVAINIWLRMPFCLKCIVLEYIIPADRFSVLEISWEMLVLKDILSYELFFMIPS